MQLVPLHDDSSLSGCIHSCDSFHLFLETILLSIEQDPEMVKHAVEFLQIARFLRALYLTMVFHIYRRWLNQLKLNYVPLIAAFITLLVFVMCLINSLLNGNWK